VTDGLSSEVKGRIARKMLIIAGTTAVVLVLLGEFLTRILHFSPGALGIAGGVILFIIATRMILGGDEDEGAKRAERSGDPMSLAAYPLAVPYLLNPAGIVVLVTFSGEVRSFTWFGLVDMKDWDTALTKMKGTVNTVGLYTMGRKERKVAKEYRRLVEEYSHLPISSSKFPILTA